MCYLPHVSLGLVDSKSVAMGEWVACTTGWVSFGQRGIYNRDQYVVHVDSVYSLCSSFREALEFDT
jgi:hypothetical protein